MRVHASVYCIYAKCVFVSVCIYVYMFGYQNFCKVELLCVFVCVRAWSDLCVDFVVNLRRRSSGVGASVSARSQATSTQQQQRSQQSQQSFSLGVSSSQLGIFSQFSQSSLDETLTNNEPRMVSQEREPLAKRTSCLPPINHAREDSQMQLSRSSTNSVRKWSAPEYKGQIGEELDHRIGMIETSLSRVGIMLDSIQSDVMQVNKGTKEVLLGMESIRQKLIFHDDSLQLVNKGQEDIKSVVDEALKPMSIQIKRDKDQENIQEIISMLSAVPQKLESCVHRLQSDLLKDLTRKIEERASSMKVPTIKIASPTSNPSVGITYRSASWDLKKVPVQPKVQQAPLVAKNETAGWKSVKREQVPVKNTKLNRRPNQKGVSPIQLETQNRVIIESDDDTDEGFSCLLNEKEKGGYLGSKTGNYSVENAKEDTERILRKARRRKRKYGNPIIIN